MGLWSPNKEKQPEPTPETKPAEQPPAWEEGLKAAKDANEATQAEVRGLSERINQLMARFPPPASTENKSEERSDDEQPVLSEAAKIALDKEFNPMRQQMGMMAAQLAESNFRNAHASDPVFRKFEPQFNSLLAAQPLAARTDPNIIANCWRIIREQNLAAVYEIEFAGKGNTGVGHGGGLAPGAAAAPVKPEDSLTPLEIAQAAKNRITPAQYAAQKAKLKFVSV